MKNQLPLMVLTTPIGTIAIPVDVAFAARQRANELIAEPIYQPDENPTRTTLLSADKMAELFDMNATWFRLRARENCIPHIRIGKYVRFDPDEIRAFFQRNPDRHANSEETHPQQHADSKR